MTDLKTETYFCLPLHFSSLMLFLTALLIYNAHSIKFPPLECIVQYLYYIPGAVQPLQLSDFRTCSEPPREATDPFIVTIDFLKIHFY